MTGNEILRAYLVWLTVERGRRPATKEAYERDIRNFLDWLSIRADDISKVKAADIDRFISQLRISGLAESSVARVSASLRGFFSFALGEHYILNDPTANLKPLRRKRSLPKPISEADMAILLDSIDGDAPMDRRYSALLELLYGTGCRVSEAIGIRLGDLDFSESLIKVTGKGAKQRLVPMGKTLVGVIGRYLQSGARQTLLHEKTSDRLFLSARGSDLTRQGVDLIVRKRAMAAGLPSAHLSAHVFRHSCATHMLEHGADIRVVQELLGHASIATTQAYTALTDSSLRREYLEAHPRANG